MTENIVDLEALYDDFYQRMVRIAASKREFVDVLGAEDALQEAGLGWVLGVRAWVNSGRKAQGAGRKIPMLSVKDEALSAKQGLMPNAYGLRPDDEELRKAGLPIPYSECPELEEFHKFLNTTIYQHLIHAERDELRYYKYVHCDEIDECGLPQVASVDEIIMERERLSTEEWRLEALRMFLAQPALMELIGLTTKESVIIYKFYHDNLTNREVAKSVKLSNTRTDFLRQRALKKLLKFLS